MSDPSPPTTATKRAASPLSPDLPSSKRAREEIEAQDSEPSGADLDDANPGSAVETEHKQGNAAENGTGQEEAKEGSNGSTAAGTKKMDDVNMDR
jgi:hypothetical protein